MFGVRLRSGIILMIIAAVLLVSGGGILWAAMMMISLIGVMELYRAFDFHRTPLAVAGYLFSVVYYVLLLWRKEEGTIFIALFLLVCLLAIYVFCFPKYRAEQVMATFFGFFYVSVMISYIYQTRMLAGGKFLVWLILICSWGCDTSAYCVGMLWGKRKLAPVLSPKKSIEGAIGGVLGSTLLGVIYALIFSKQLNVFAHPVASLALLGAVGAVISQIGDLGASAIKRNHEIKDYGKLIPGHGGILDRFDSVIFTAPIVYYLTLFLQNLQ